MKTHQSSRLRINVTSTGSELRCSIGVLIFLFIITSGIQHVEGRTSLNPLAIGVRSAIARAPVLTSHPPSSKFTIHRKADLNRFDAPLKYDDVESDEIENLPSVASSIARGGGTAVAPTDRRLHFWEAMVCGAISRSAAQTIMHPANTMKTILQSSRSIPGKAPLTVKSFARWENAKMLTRGAGAQLLLSIPHGAVNFAVLEFVRRQMNNVVSRSRYAERINRGFGPGMDFLSSALSTVCCSVVSTPQMMICDNIMAGTYPNLVAATSCLMKDRGISGFYTGWWPGIAGKIPSYGLTWTLFEQIKLARTKMFKRPAKDIENSIMGCLASATTVCIMIPMDTVKTRLVTQMNYPDLVPYKGINDCFRRVLKEEGIGAFYRGLTPRLLSVVPMIGIQFGVYEFMKKFMLARDAKTSLLPARGRVSKAEMKRREDEAAIEKSRKERLLQEMALEVAADDDQPFPAPYFKHKGWWAEKISGK